MVEPSECAGCVRVLVTLRVHGVSCNVYPSVTLRVLSTEQHPGIRTREQYVGCIANVVLGRDVQDLNSGQANGGVLTGGCPSN